MKKSALYPGSFDPFTKGHENIILKALSIFDEITIGIGKNTEKKGYFTQNSRLEHIKNIYKNEKKINVIEYVGLTVDLCRKLEINFIIRGLRSCKDFDFEFNISMNNKILNKDVETIFFSSDLEFIPIQSSIIREIHKSGGEINSFVTEHNYLRTY